ncbi:serine-enriched protein [Anopheles darlingi]|uniref:Serine-enriched protein n=1 Tax=Anopheles darlingi TaxID=43151 RepID=W5JSC0_ANODA|nr:serine-enriched protein [Anopheles darlingi]
MSHQHHHHHHHQQQQGQQGQQGHHLHQPGHHGHSSRSLPKIRKAKSQSFRTRRSPSERSSSKGGHVSPWNFSAATTSGGSGGSTSNNNNNNSGSRSPAGTHQQAPSVPSMSRSPMGSQTHLEHRSSIGSAKSPCLSRQGTLRSSHRRKSSLGASLNLSQGRRSPSGMLNDRSPSASRPKSPNLLITDQMYASSFDRRSPTAMSFSGRRSPSGLRSPSGPLGFNLQSEYSELLQSQQERCSPNSLSSHQSYQDRRTSPTAMHLPPERSRSPVGGGGSGGSGFGLPLSRSTRTSPTTLGNIPPITISNPSETYEIVQKSIETGHYPHHHHHHHHHHPHHQGQQSRSPKSPKSPLGHGPDLAAGLVSNGAQASGGSGSAGAVPKEKTSVMKEILAFVRKPSSKKMTTRTSKFTAAFTRTESTTGAPLLRQSTFSSIQNSSSCAGRNAITKQMSEIAFEPIMSSLKWKNVGSKISLKSLKKLSQGVNVGIGSGGGGGEQTAASGGGAASDKRSRDKRSSGDEISDVESSDGAVGGSSGLQNVNGAATSGHSMQASGMEGCAFEVLESVHFEKVGEAYIKHDQIREEESPRGSQDSADASDGEAAAASLGDGRLKVSAVSEIKKSLEALFTRQEPIDEAGEDGGTGSARGGRTEPDAIQCPTFEIEPPSRRASFDPPRSPFLENLRSLSDTDHEGTHHSRLDSGGDSFEMIDTTDRMPGSSVSGDRHSSMDTSFDISRYQSTSYEDQNSSFELVELDNSQRGEKALSPYDIRKSSIELVDAETFQRTTYPEGRKSSLETHFDLADSYHQPAHPRSTSPRSAFSVISGTRAPTRKQISEPGRCRDSLGRSSGPPGGAGAGTGSVVGGTSGLATGSGMKTHHSAPHRAKSPLSNQTSSNFSSRDSYDSIFETTPPQHYHHHHHHQQQQQQQQHHHYVQASAGGGSPLQRSPYSSIDGKQHFPLPPPRKSSNESNPRFLCTDKRCAAIFEPRPLPVAPVGVPMAAAAAASSSGGRLSSCYLDTSSGSEFEPPSPRRAASASPKHTFTFRIVLKKVDSSPDAICPSIERRQLREKAESRHKRRDSRRKKLLEIGKSF